MRSVLILGIALFGLAWLLHQASTRFSPRPDFSGWGLNPGSFAFGSPGAKQHLFAALRFTGITYLRENVPQDGSPPARPPGRKILGLIPYYFGLSHDKVMDLRAVYQTARRLGAREGRNVDVWENYNEPDLSFNPAPPDRSVAFMKAVYLGLKDSSTSPVPVLLPALGLPPGPWLDRAERNGLLSYGDALTFHYYSNQQGFPEEIRLLQEAQRRAVSAGQLPRALPLWLTEIGLDSVPLGHPDDAAGRRRQAGFFRETARVASAMGLAAFMPYAYDDVQRGFNLANPAQQPYAAWDAYADASRATPLDTQPKWIDQSRAAPRVILQWLPDPSVCRPHKVSGTYRFLHRSTPITGRVRIYSFADKKVVGILHVGLQSTNGIQARWINQFGPTSGSSGAWPVVLAPGAVQDTKLILTAPLKGYAMGWIEARFTDTSVSPEPPSLLRFGCETRPREDDFRDLPCYLDPPASTATGYDFHSIDDPHPATVTSSAGPWLGLNGMQVAPGPMDRMVNPAWTFQLDQPSMKPGEPPMAVARISHLPAAGFLHLSSDHLLGQDVGVRVDLIDDQGQRFSIFENSGLDPGQVSNRLWLNLADFHRYFWGRFVPGHDFDPHAVREIQLRFYFKFLHDPVQIGFETLRPRLMKR